MDPESKTDGDLKQILRRLSQWYGDQCDGEWEHEFGITIETIDNPGWSVKVDLVDTTLAETAIPRLDEKKSESDWIVCYRDDSQFCGAGDPTKLEDILQYFLRYVE
jgi:hypothetical protein